GGNRAGVDAKDEHTRNVKCLMLNVEWTSRKTFNIQHSTFNIPRLPESHLVNLPPLGPVLGLVIGPGRIRGAGDARLGSEELGDERRGGVEIFAMVGDVDARSPVDEHTPHLGQRLGANDAPLLLAPFRPWVREIHMYF